MTTPLIISLPLLAHILWKLHLWNWLQPSADCQCMPDPPRLISFTKASAILHLDSIWSLAALQQHLWLCTRAGASTHLSRAVRICCCMFLHSSALKQLLAIFSFYKQKSQLSNWGIATLWYNFLQKSDLSVSTFSNFYHFVWSRAIDFYSLQQTHVL